MVYSKIQIRILDLYKRYLRAIKDHPESYRNFIKDSFREGAKKYSKNDFLIIEHQIARGEHKLTELKFCRISGYSRVQLKEKQS
uniref:Complex1_LYR_dom domain-containing protein n=1 Tax=Strongyloides venezuelensis TaxID=75913 RepID=A0A0K0F757_STRVS